MIGSIITFVVAIALILLVLKLLGKSMKIIWTVLINSIIGFVVLFILNLIPGVNIELNWWSALLTGALGIPGVIIVLILQLVLHI